MEPSASHPLRPRECGGGQPRGWSTGYSCDSERRDNPSPDTGLTGNLQTTTRLLRALSHRPKAKVAWEIAGSIEARAIVCNLELERSAR